MAADIKPPSLAQMPRVWGDGASSGGLGEGAKRDASRGATETWVFGSALVFLTNMGHVRPKRLAEKLLQIREALGLTQKEIAERLGIHRTHHHISQYERGKAVPFMEVLLAYARLANVEMNKIVDDDLDLNLFCR